MKIIFQGDTKRVAERNFVYEELMAHCQRIFQIGGAEAPALKFFYQDDDCEIISISCQADLIFARNLMKSKLKLILAPSALAVQDMLSLKRMD